MDVYFDHTHEQWVGEHETRDSLGEVTRQTEWFTDKADAIYFARTGLLPLTTEEQFFYANAGYSYDPLTETPEQGRQRCARVLAAAERRLKTGPYFISVIPDDVPWDGDVPYDGPLWIVQLWSVGASSEAHLIGSIGGVATETDTDPYIRVVSAELASEYID